MSYIEDHVLAYKAPLYGRRTAQMKILPFNFEETCLYFKKLSDEDKTLIYGVVGGTPQYLLQMNDNLSVEDNMFRFWHRFAECKWTNEKVDLNVLATLAKRSRLFPYKNVHLYLFSKSGFTKGCIDEANRMGNVTLASYADIVAQ